jgi:hypothetical protein
MTGFGPHSVIALILKLSDRIVNTRAIGACYHGRFKEVVRAAFAEQTIGDAKIRVRASTAAY